MTFSLSCYIFLYVRRISGLLLALQIVSEIQWREKMPSGKMSTWIDLRVTVIFIYIGRFLIILKKVTSSFLFHKNDIFLDLKAWYLCVPLFLLLYL